MTRHDDTIFALSSGALPAALAVVRVSGTGACAAVRALAGSLPSPRRAGLRTLRDASGKPLDQALVIAFPAPGSATGEDLVELHLHGGRAVVRAALATLAAQPGLRAAEPGEFTRRALANGRIDLAQAEGLADLLAAESETARRSALAAAGGAVTRQVDSWLSALTDLAARIEVLIDFSEEDDVAASGDAIAALRAAAAAAGRDLANAAASPTSERLRDGIRVVFAGPPNAGKSSLVNALAEREVAIATPVPGTTRDRIEAAVLHGGVAWVLTDVAGLRIDVVDEVEAIGVALAEAAISEADILVWLGDGPSVRTDAILVHARNDIPGREVVPSGRIALSVVSGDGLALLWHQLHERATALLPREDMVAFNRRQAAQLAAAADVLAAPSDDLIVLAEQLRIARCELSMMTGQAQTDAMLDALFAQFCIGK